MTRKQAALKAIELLSGSEENKEVCEALGKIVNGRLTEIWNKELVLEAIQDFALAFMLECIKRVVNIAHI